MVKRIVATFLMCAMVIGSFFTVAGDNVSADTELQQYEAGIIAADEVFATDFLTRLYVNMLGREPDAAGLRSWIDALENGECDGNSAAAGFYDSPEFTELSSHMDNSEFVKIMYHTVLGRSPDTDGHKAWTQKLDTNEIARRDVFEGFLGSSEWQGICGNNYILSGHYKISLFVDRLYYTTLGRAADADGKATWVSAIVDGMSGAEVAAGFFGSQEYISRNASNTDFVASLYATMLDRAPDQAGLESWVAYLSSHTREEVIYGMAGSDEFGRICAEHGMNPLPVRRIDPNRPMIAITYDDGPGPYTNKILDCLEANNARATFFMIGSNAQYYPETVARVDALGCEIGNHTWTHPRLSSLGADGITSELSRTNDAINAIVGHNPTVMRPPYGAYNDTVQQVAGFPIITWDVDTRDWATRSTEKTVESVMANAHDGAIILMHDIHASTADAALQIIPALIEAGYQLVTVSEMAQYRGGLENGRVYRSIRP